MKYQFMYKKCSILGNMKVASLYPTMRRSSLYRYYTFLRFVVVV